MRNYFPKLNVVKSISDSKLNSNPTSMRLDGINSDNKIVSFTDTMKEMVNNLNEVSNAPDVAMQDMLTGNGADIHDVIMAINNAELSVNIATQVTTKVVQAYEKIMNIQV